MTLNEQQEAKLLDKIQGHLRVCCCGSNSWQLQSTLYLMPACNSADGATAAVVAICHRCFHMRLYAARMLGIMDQNGNLLI